MTKTIFKIISIFFLSSSLLAKTKIRRSKVKASSHRTSPSSYSIKIIKKSSLVKFKAIGKPGFLKVNGTSKKKLTGKLSLSANNKLSGLFKFPMKTLATGMSLRDRHMKNKYLEVKKFPEASLEILKLQLPKNFIKKPNIKKLPFEGKLTIHGKSIQAKGIAKIEKQKNKKIKITATTKTTIAAHDIKKPGFMGITLAEEVTIEVSFLAQISKNPSP